MGGRRPLTDRPDVLVALGSLWENPEKGLTFMEIHEGLYEKGIVKRLENKTTTNRILKKAIKQGIIRKEKGLYYLNTPLDFFKPMDYLMLAWKKGYIPIEIGDTFWTRCRIYVLGVPESLYRHEDLLVLAKPFGFAATALYDVWRAITKELKRRESSPSAGKRIPWELARLYPLVLILWILGYKAGIDGDGLSPDDMYKAVRRMIEGLPEEISPQQPTMKDVMRELLDEVEKLPREDKLDPQSNEEIFGIIIIPPEHLIDPNDYERKIILSILKENRYKKPFYIAALLKDYNEELVLPLIDVQGIMWLGKKEAERVKTIYTRIKLAEKIGIILEAVQNKEIDKKEARSRIEKILAEEPLNDVIKMLPFTTPYWAHPDKRKLSLLESVLEEDGNKLIEWLRDGLALYQEYIEEILRSLHHQLARIKEKEESRLEG